MFENVFYQIRAIVGLAAAGVALVLLIGLGQVVLTSVIGYLSCPNIWSPSMSALDATNSPATFI